MRGLGQMCGRRYIKVEVLLDKRNTERKKTASLVTVNNSSLVSHLRSSPPVSFHRLLSTVSKTSRGLLVFWYMLL